MVGDADMAPVDEFLNLNGCMRFHSRRARKREVETFVQLISIIVRLMYSGG